MALDCALVFPPQWYFHAVPADLSETGAVLRSRGLRVGCFDLKSTLDHALLGEDAGFKALRRPEVYGDDHVLRMAWGHVDAAAEAVAARFGVSYDLRELRFPGVDPADAGAASTVGLDEARNPALPLMRATVEKILKQEPIVVGIACVHPDQIIQALVFARLMREGGYIGLLVLYGSLEDVVAPADFAPDLLGNPDHVLFEHVDGVIVGEAESALLALCFGHEPIPNYLTSWDRQLPERHVEDLREWPPAYVSWVKPEHHPFPAPVVDLRLGRGCPWGRCAFCAIQAHQVGYRAGSAARVAESMRLAHKAHGSIFFRIRDDLITPTQVRALAAAIEGLSFQPRWLARSRFEPGLTREVLELAAAAGLEELWLGLESGSVRVRNLMFKGVREDIIARILKDARAVGIRVRALCMVGFPGETWREHRETVRFLLRHEHELTGALSLTPFQLTRLSPMASSLDEFGLELAEDPLPPTRRLRYSLPVRRTAGASAADVHRWFEHSLWDLAHIADRHVGPTPSHDWLRASLTRTPWPGTDPATGDTT